MEDYNLEEALGHRLTIIMNKMLELSSMAETFSKEDVGKENTQDAQICVSKLDVVVKRFTTEMNEYFKLVNQPSADLISEMTENQLKTEEILAELKYKLEKDIVKNRSNVQVERTYGAKLPTLTLPEFSGDILKWSEYWDIFKSNIHTRSIADVDKLLYLKSTLKEEPRKIIDGLETTNKNYEIAINILQDRYGKPTQIIDAHYSAIRKIKTAEGSIKETRLTFNEIERNLRVLHSLGEDINHNHLRHLITEKFPEDIIYEMKMRMREETVEEMRKHLDDIIAAREEAYRLKLEKGSIEKENKAIETLYTTSKEVSQRKYTNGRRFNNRYTDRNPVKKENTYNREFKQRNNYKGKPQSTYWSRNKQDNRKRDYEQGSKPEVKESKRRKIQCTFCGEEHYSDQCNKYKTILERKLMMKDSCFKCLRKGHRSRYCKGRRYCIYCRSTEHHRSLCPLKFTINKTESTTMTTLNYGTITVLQTAIITLENTVNKRSSMRCRILLDSGSQRSYINKQVSRKLELPILEENRLSIFSFASNKPQNYDSNRVEIELTTKSKRKIKLQVNEIPFISKGVDPPSKILSRYTDKILSDDGSLGNKIDILIGNDYYFDLISTEKIKLNESLFLIESELGYIISGKIPVTEKENTLSVITYCQHHDPKCIYYTEPDLPLKNMDIKFLWSLESIGITDNPKATREDEAVKHFNETIKYENGRYRVKWPWIHYPPDLPTNFGLAYGRLKGLIQRLREDNLKEYQIILDEQLKNNIIEIVEPGENIYNQRTPPIHYLAHHMIKQEGKRGRIVYDASGKLKEGKSLNENMYRGPSMIGDLVTLLIQFRTHKIGTTADVEKAFLQIELQTEDRDVTRFLWIKDTDKPISMDNIVHIRFCRVPFGIIASPFILTATLKYHAAQTAPESVSSIIEKCYVDNFVTGTDSTNEAIQLYENTQKIFNTISMNMRDWISNDKPFIDTIPEEHKAKNQTETKILGLIWNTENDTLKLNIKEETVDRKLAKESQSKRKILSKIASIYDPCGICVPLTLPIKLLLQELWDKKIKWDTNLPEDLQEKWEILFENLQNLREVQVPRFMGIDGEIDKNKITYELHVYSDASKLAYGAVVYLVSESRNRRNTAFVIAKSKVVPKEEREKLHMPRLELLGCYLGSKLIMYIRNVIGIPISKQFLWTDSQIVLSWIHSNKLLPPFIARRINTIKENKQLEMRYVNTDLNPADLATRPDMWHKKKSLWLEGPEFLKHKKHFWPNNNRVFETSHSVRPEGPSDIVNLMEIDDNIPEITFQEQYEVSKNKNRDTEHLNKIQELKKLQENYFPLESEGRKTSLAINLDIFKDIDGILRCNGRMKNADWPFDKRHPILIPRECEFTEELIMKNHKENYHMGANHTLSKVRDTYWIPKGKSYVQRVIKKCPECIKYNGGPFKLPPAPSLPQERVNYTAPFTYTGIDYLGPLATNNGTNKRWVCLFTCLAVRAVHLEVIQDLTAEEGLLALRRMISTRGIPVLITSDNAQHFKLIADIISNQYCIDKKIKWRFINPLSPWAGGFYERLIGIVKNCMKKTIDKHKLTDNQLATIIKEIEAVVNSRPLTSVDSELDYTLRPSDFLTVGRVIALDKTTKNVEPQNASVTKTQLIQGWKRALKILEEFKEMFSNRYLLSLRERYNHLPREPRVTSNLNPIPGQIVQMKGESKDRTNWKIGKIISLIPSTDGQCRAAKVQAGKNEYIRSIAHLYPLEINEATFKDKEITQPKTPTANVDRSIETSSNERLNLIPKQMEETERIIPSEVYENSKPKGQMEPKEDERIVQTDIELLPTINETTEGKPIQKVRREAATRAIKKIKEWTQDLGAYLLLSEVPPLGSVAEAANSVENL